jgi:hypothetical protein
MFSQLSRMHITMRNKTDICQEDVPVPFDKTPACGTGRRSLAGVAGVDDGRRHGLEERKSSRQVQANRWTLVYQHPTWLRACNTGANEYSLV